jgi:hypothetical protein
MNNASVTSVTKAEVTARFRAAPGIGYDLKIAEVIEDFIASSPPEQANLPGADTGNGSELGKRGVEWQRRARLASVQASSAVSTASAATTRTAPPELFPETHRRRVATPCRNDEKLIDATRP